MKTVQDAYAKLLNEYTDINSRTTLYHKDESNPATGLFDSENQHLWQGEANIWKKVYIVGNHRVVWVIILYLMMDMLV